MMRPSLLVALFGLSTAYFANAQVSITKSPVGWQMTNGNIHVELVRSSQTVQLKSLRREGGPEWAAAGSPLVAIPAKAGNQYRFSEDAISDLSKDGKQLTLCF